MMDKELLPTIIIKRQVAVFKERCKCGEIVDIEVTYDCLRSLVEMFDYENHKTLKKLEDNR